MVHNDELVSLSGVGTAPHFFWHVAKIWTFSEFHIWPYLGEIVFGSRSQRHETGQRSFYGIHAAEVSKIKHKSVPYIPPPKKEITEEERRQEARKTIAIKMGLMLEEKKRTHVNRLGFGSTAASRTL